MALRYSLCTVEPSYHLNSDVLGVSGLSGAAVVLVLNGRFYIQAAANAKHSLFVYIHLVVVYQIILNPAVTLIWVLRMYLFHNFCNLLIFQLSGALFATKPTIIGCSGHPQQFTCCFYRVAVFLVTFFYCQVDMGLSYLAQPRLLSISSNFFSR